MGNKWSLERREVDLRRLGPEGIVGCLTMHPDRIRIRGLWLARGDCTELGKESAMREGTGCRPRTKHRSAMPSILSRRPAI